MVKLKHGVKCPNCGGDVVWDDTYDTDEFHDAYVKHCMGICEKCNLKVYYELQYSLGDPLIDIEEIEEDD